MLPGNADAFQPAWCVRCGDGYAAFSSPGSLPLPAPGGGGLRLEAVMENLQRQQAARLARVEEKLRRGQAEPGPGQLRSAVGSRIQQQALALQQYQAAVRCGLAPRGRLGGSPPGPGAPEPGEEEEDLEEEAGAARYPPRSPSAPQQRPEPARSLSPPRQPPPQHHEWTYEEQFKQVRARSPRASPAAPQRATPTAVPYQGSGPHPPVSCPHISLLPRSPPSGKVFH
ncbi:diacylglycerol O-acyltransferase 1 [Platysternon megacephalum]|uniref:Diacylglycerol O-acyltransferase 1 n=1 Tax=Platysternon megacephalum TaxID=55544 RepID=A0A4D9DW31_9SAUR|nr:diacylglycerol O-acyltransferase 1 [Platysternon megacephalum]